MYFQLAFALLFFILCGIGFYYFFRFQLRKFVAKHRAGKMDLGYKLFIVVGCLCFLFSLFGYMKTKNHIDHAKRITGKVIKLIESEHNYIQDGDSTKDKEICFTPVFSYVNSENIPVVIKSKTCQYPAAFSIGDSVDLFVNEDNPEALPIENEWFALWGGSLIHSFLSGIFLAFGSLGLLIRDRQKKREKLLTL